MKPQELLPKSHSYQLIGSPIAYYPNIAKVIGSAKATLLLCQFLYWEGKQADSDGWIYKTQEEIYNETELSRTEQERARAKLRELGILEEKYSGIPRKLYFKVNWQRLDDLIVAYYNAENQHAEMQNVGFTACISSADCNAEVLQTITENTHENTHKNTSSFKKKSCRIENIAIDNNLEWLMDRFRFYFGRDTLTAFELYEYEQLIIKYGREQVDDALKKAKEQNKMSLAYVKGILGIKGHKKKSIWDDYVPEFMRGKDEEVK